MLAAKEEMLICGNDLLSENSRPGYRAFSRPLYWRRRSVKSRKALGKSRFLRQNRVGCYDRARYYSPRMQRFISEDPIGFMGGDNLYAYVVNNPINLIDPRGLEVINPGNYPISQDVQESLERFNDFIGRDKDVIITGGNRPPTSTLGAGSTSQHVQGTAADIYVPGQSHLQTANQAAASGLFGGIGWYEEGYRGPHGEGPHTHVDLRNESARWGFDRFGNRYRGSFPPFHDPNAPPPGPPRPPSNPPPCGRKC